MTTSTYTRPDTLLAQAQAADAEVARVAEANAAAQAAREALKPTTVNAAVKSAAAVEADRVDQLEAAIETREDLNRFISEAVPRYARLHTELANLAEELFAATNDRRRYDKDIASLAAIPVQLAEARHGAASDEHVAAVREQQHVLRERLTRHAPSFSSVVAPGPFREQVAAMKRPF